MLCHTAPSCGPLRSSQQTASMGGSGGMSLQNRGMTHPSAPNSHCCACNTGFSSNADSCASYNNHHGAMYHPNISTNDQAGGGMPQNHDIHSNNPNHHHPINSSHSGHRHPHHIYNYNSHQRGPLPPHNQQDFAQKHLTKSNSNDATQFYICECTTCRNLGNSVDICCQCCNCGNLAAIQQQSNGGEVVLSDYAQSRGGGYHVSSVTLTGDTDDTLEVVFDDTAGSADGGVAGELVVDEDDEEMDRHHHHHHHHPAESSHIRAGGMQKSHCNDHHHHHDIHHRGREEEEEEDEEVADDIALAHAVAEPIHHGRPLHQIAAVSCINCSSCSCSSGSVGKPTFHGWAGHPSQRMYASNKGGPSVHYPNHNHHHNHHHPHQDQHCGATPPHAHRNPTGSSGHLADGHQGHLASHHLHYNTSSSPPHLQRSGIRNQSVPPTNHAVQHQHHAKQPVPTNNSRIISKSHMTCCVQGNGGSSGCLAQMIV